LGTPLKRAIIEAAAWKDTLYHQSWVIQFAQKTKRGTDAVDSLAAAGIKPCPLQ
jgi:hypothetical protein